MNDLAGGYFKRIMLETRDALNVLEQEQFDELGLLLKECFDTLIDISGDDVWDSYEEMYCVSQTELTEM